MAGSTALSSHSTTSPRVLHEEPLRGQIWAASASAILPVLQAAAGCTVAGLSVAMQTDKDALERADSLPIRPCLIIRSDPMSQTVVAVVFTTLGRGLTDITEADRYFQHFAVSVGETPAWPSQDSWVLPTEPRWTAVPQYLSACMHVLPYDSLVGRFRTEVSRDYVCDDRSLLKLVRICREKAAAYQAKTSDELSTWAASYKISKDRYLARVGTRDSSNGSATLSLRPASDTTRRYSGPYRPGVNGPSTPCPSLAAQEHRPGRRPAFRATLAMQPISENLAFSPGHRAPSLAGSVAAQSRAHNRFSILALDSGESDSDDPDSEPVPSLSHSPDTSSCESSPNTAPRDLESSPATAALSLPDTTDAPDSRPRKRLAHEKDKRCPEDVGVPGMCEDDHASVRPTPLKRSGQSPATMGRIGVGGRTCGQTFNGTRYYNGRRAVVSFKPTGLGLHMGHGMVTSPRTVI